MVSTTPTLSFAIRTLGWSSDGGIDAKAVLAGVAIIVSVTTFGLSYWHSRRTSTLGIRPILAFVYDGNRGWVLRNIGYGPALNVIVAQKRVGGEWFNPVRIPPLPKDGELVLSWLGHVNDTGLGAAYTDFVSRPYSSTCGNDLSRVFDGEELPKWKEEQIGKHWNQPPYQGSS